MMIGFFVILTVSPLSVSPSFSQIAADLGVGWNEGVADYQGTAPPYTAVQENPVYAVAFFVGSLRGEGLKSRSGLGFIVQDVKFEHEGDEDGAQNHRIKHFLFEHERLLARTQRADVVLRLGGGFASRAVTGEGDGSQTMFGALQNLDWVLSPGIRCVIPLVKELSLTTGLRGNLYLEDPDETYPFRSSVMILVGIEYFHRSPADTSPH